MSYRLAMAAAAVYHYLLPPTVWLKMETPLDCLGLVIVSVLSCVFVWVLLSMSLVMVSRHVRALYVVGPALNSWHDGYFFQCLALDGTGNV